MAEAFSVDPEVLADAVQQMAEFQRDAEGMLTEIDSLVTNLHVTWSGEGASAHAEAHRHLSRGEQMMREALAQLQEVADTAHGNYTDARTANLRMWS
jgi:WXG100 family type VII secretion target